MQPTLVLLRPDPHQITCGWPDCCKDAYPNRDLELSYKQNRAAKWIKRSLIPWYCPCETCSNDITRRYHDKHREWIGSRIKWEEFNILDNNISLSDLKVVDLCRIGATAGCSDFMSVVLEHQIDGRLLCQCINGQSLATGRDILYDEWCRIVDVLKEMKVSLNCIANQRYDNNKFINNKLKDKTTEKSSRIQAAAGVFGKFGKEYGCMGSDCGGFEIECAEIGRERGGRKAGGKNTLSLTNNDRLKYCSMFEAVPKSAWSYVIKATFRSFVFDNIKKQWNYDKIKYIKDDIENWFKKLSSLKEARVHKRGHLKSFNLGRKPQIGGLEEAIDEILECEYNGYEFLCKNSVIITLNNYVDELDDYKIDNNCICKKINDNQWDRLIRIDVRWVDRFIKRRGWSAVTNGSSTAVNVLDRLPNLWPHIVSLWGLMLSCGRDPGKDLMNTDPTLLTYFFLKCKALIKTRNPREHGGQPPRQNAMKGIGINYTIRSDGEFTNFLFTLVTQSKNYQLSNKLKKLILELKQPDDKFDGGGSWDGWVKDSNELKRVKMHDAEERLQFEYADNGDVLHKPDILNYLLYQKHVYRMASSSNDTALANAADAYCQAKIKQEKARKNLSWTGSEEAKKTATGTYRSPSDQTQIKHLYDIYRTMKDEKEAISNSFAQTVYGLPYYDKSKDKLAFRHKIDKHIADNYNYDVSNKTAKETLNIKLKPGPPESQDGRGGVAMSRDELHNLNITKTQFIELISETEKGVQSALDLMREQAWTMKNYFEKDVEKRMNIINDTPIIDIEISRALMHRELICDYTMWTHNDPNDIMIAKNFLFQVIDIKPNRIERNQYVKINNEIIKNKKNKQNQQSTDKNRRKTQKKTNNKSGQRKLTFFINNGCAVSISCIYTLKMKKKQKKINKTLMVNKSDRFEVLKQKFIKTLQKQQDLESTKLKQLKKALQNDKHWKLIETATNTDIVDSQLIGTRDIKNVTLKYCVIIINVYMVHINDKDKILQNKHFVLPHNAYLIDLHQEIKKYKKWKKNYQNQPLYVYEDDQELTNNTSLSSQNLEFEGNVYFYGDKKKKSKKKKNITNSKRKINSNNNNNNNIATIQHPQIILDIDDCHGHGDDDNNRPIIIDLDDVDSDDDDIYILNRKKKKTINKSETVDNDNDNDDDLKRNDNKSRKGQKRYNTDCSQYRHSKKRRLDRDENVDDIQNMNDYILCTLQEEFRSRRSGQIAKDQIFKIIQSKKPEINQNEFDQSIQSLSSNFKIYLVGSTIHQI